MRKPLVEVIVNKNWEVEPFMAGMKATGLLGEPKVWLADMGAKNYMSSCRAEFHMERIDVIVRCIQDMMNDPEKGTSNSEEKYCLLPAYIAADKPDLIVSVSTAESTLEFQGGESGTENGSVVVGGDFFMFNARKYDKDSESNLDVVAFQDNNVAEDIYSLFMASAAAAVKQFDTPPHNPAAPLRIAADQSYVSIGVVNVEHYECYRNADPAAYEEFSASAYSKDTMPVSIETTHGIVRMSAGDIQTVFVSPIVDRYEKFSEDVDDEQNRVAGYNAGVAVAHFLVDMNHKPFGADME